MQRLSEKNLIEQVTRKKTLTLIIKLTKLNRCLKLILTRTCFLTGNSQGVSSFAIGNLKCAFVGVCFAIRSTQWFVDKGTATLAFLI